jgi:hypothetical protein
MADEYAGSVAAPFPVATGPVGAFGTLSGYSPPTPIIAGS